MDARSDFDSERRLDEIETAVTAIQANLHTLRQQASRADERAAEHDARSDAQDARMDSMEAQSALDRRVFAQLQADGLVSDEHTAHLEKALSSSRRIGAAIGMVMHAKDVDEAGAFELLCRTSQHSNRRLRALADEIVGKGDVSILEP